MNTLYLTVIVIALYFPAILLLWRSCFRPQSLANTIANILIVVGWLVQGTALHYMIDSAQGQNLSLTNLAATVSWMMLGLLVIGNLRSQVKLLIMVMLAVGALTQALAQWLPSERLFSLVGNPAAVIHILTSLLAYSFLALAALQAILVWRLDYRLKHLRPPSHPFIPPLMAMEQLLFQLLLLGFIVLSISIAVGFIYLEDYMASQTLHKLVLSIASWMLFSLLLLGHWKFGWRGKQAAKWTLIAFAVLALGSFGTWMVTTLILGR